MNDFQYDKDISLKHSKTIIGNTEQQDRSNFLAHKIANKPELLIIAHIKEKRDTVRKTITRNKKLKNLAIHEVQQVDYVKNQQTKRH